MILSFHPCFEADVQVILGDKRLESHHLELIRNAGAIILPQSCSKELYEVCCNGGTRVFPNYDIRFRYTGKVGQAALFRRFDVPHPETVCWADVKEFKESCQGARNLPHPFPFLLKQDTAHEAEGVYLVKDGLSLARALGDLHQKERIGFKGFVSQEFIDCDGNVLRAVILGNEIITYWKRPRKEEEVITTISRGARIDHVWRPDLQERGKALVVEFARKTGLNLAAIDLLLSPYRDCPEGFFLEINYFFARRGLGGSERYYMLLFRAVQGWLRAIGLDPGSVRLV